MTGGGFAGGCVALVEAERTDRFIAAMHASYDGTDAQPATEPVRYWPVLPSLGAEVLTAP